MDNTVDVHFPATERPLPSSAQIRRIVNLPLIQLFVVGRSGSILLHSLLDSHPHVLDIPHTFKFYDFVFSPDGMAGASVAKLGQRFVDFDQHRRFFDSSLSVHIGGRLGPEMRHRILVDKNAFCLAFMHCLRECSRAACCMNTKTVFYCIQIAYGWCVGRDLDQVRVVFHHLHHGDWLYPDLLLDFFNLKRELHYNSADIMKADRLVLTVRDPYRAYSSVCNYAAQISSGRNEEIKLCDLYLRLLLQDWIRLRFLTVNTEIPLLSIRMEDMHSNIDKVLEDFGQFSGVSASVPQLQVSQFYGYAWHGDIYTVPTTAVGNVKHRKYSDFWQDNVLIDYALDSFPTQFGYSSYSAAHPEYDVRKTLLDPSPRQLMGEGTDAVEHARKLAQERIFFADRLKQLMNKHIAEKS